MREILKCPSAWIPLAMSFAALAIVLGKAVRFGVVHEADEGTDAHVFQLLIAAQALVVAFFRNNMATTCAHEGVAGVGTPSWCSDHSIRCSVFFDLAPSRVRTRPGANALRTLFVRG